MSRLQQARSPSVTKKIAGALLCAVTAASCTFSYAGDFPDLGNVLNSAKSAINNNGNNSNGKNASDTGNGNRTQSGNYSTEGEAVITAGPETSFAKAQGNTISAVQDGEPVYFHARLPKPLKDYLFTPPAIDFQCVRLVVGPRGKPREQFESSNVKLKSSELNSNELHLNLAPGEVRASFVAAWLETVARGRPGHWENEIRLMGENETILAVAPLTAEVTSGINKYRAIFADYNQRYAMGDPSSNEAPANAHRGDLGLANDARTQITKVTGNKPEALYFSELGWFDHRNGIGQLEYQHCLATELIKIGGKPFYQNVEVRKYPNGRVEASLDGKPRELTPENYKRQLADSKP